MPRTFRDEDRIALLDRHTLIIQQDSPAAFQNIEELIHIGMPVARNAGPLRHLLGSKRNVVGASARINFEMTSPLGFVRRSPCP